MEILGIYAEDGATQIVNRDRYIEYLSVINGIAVTLEKIATEIRNLQRPEIDEISEYFDFDKQVGSSSMPSKVNPINSENVASLSRLIRSMIIPEYEAGVTWHERDLTNSASERFVIPYASILIDYATDRLNSVRKAAMYARSRGISFRQSLIENGIEKYVSRSDLDKNMDPANFIGSAPIICDMIVKKARKRIGMADGEQAS